MCRLLLFFTLFSSHAFAAAESPELPERFPFIYISNYDGDTLSGQVSVWIGVTVSVTVRLRGVDTPEIRGKCPAEIAAATEAKSFVASFAASRRLFIADVSPDKYGGRIDANVLDDQGVSLGEVLVSAGLARRYDGGARAGWCGPASREQ